MNCCKKILIVDDCPIAGAYLKSFFLKSGYTDIQIVKDGQSGIDAFAKNPKAFSLVVLDIELPDMLGFDVAKAMRKIELSHEIGSMALPIVMASATLTKERKIKALASGAQGFFDKPLNTTAKRALCVWIEQKRFTCSHIRSCEVATAGG